MILQPSVNFLFLVLTYPKICVSLPCKVIELGEHVYILFLSPNFVNFDDNTAQPWSSQSEYLSFQLIFTCQSSWSLKYFCYHALDLFQIIYIYTFLELNGATSVFQHFTHGRVLFHLSFQYPFYYYAAFDDIGDCVVHGPVSLQEVLMTIRCLPWHLTFI